MDASAFMVLAATCAPLVHPATAQAIVAVESSFNPLAIGVVAGNLQRQPRTVQEAIATAQALQVQGRDFSVGLAQINVRNLSRFGMAVADGFDGCNNLRAMQAILSECLDRAGMKAGAQHALRRALSCYYSGDFTTGFRQGYVSRVVRSADTTARAPP